MPFKKGQVANPGGRKRAAISPVTASFCKSHYERAVQICKNSEAFESTKEYFDALMTILKFEHAELYGKPKERLDVEMSGGMTFTVKIVGRGGE